VTERVLKPRLEEARERRAIPDVSRALLPYAEPATRYLGTEPGADDSRLREELDSLFADRDRMIRERS
jgi:hypothetical protein